MGRRNRNAIAPVISECSTVNSDPDPEVENYYVTTSAQPQPLPGQASFITNSSSNKTATEALNHQLPPPRQPRAAYLLPIALRSACKITSCRSNGSLPDANDADLLHAKVKRTESLGCTRRQASSKTLPRGARSCFFVAPSDDESISAAAVGGAGAAPTGARSDDDDTESELPRRGMSRWRSASSARRLGAGARMPSLSATANATSPAATAAADNEELQRAQFARSRNRAKKWDDGPDALDAFAAALPRARDGRALARTMRTLACTLPRALAAVHRDTLERASGLAVDAALALAVAPATPPSHAPAPRGGGRTTRGAVAWATSTPFGDALILAVVAAAAHGRLAVRRRVRRGARRRLAASLLLRDTVGALCCRIDVAEREQGKELVDVVLLCSDPSAPFSPRKRDAFAALADRFRNSWEALGVPIAAPIPAVNSRGWRRQVSFVLA